jgi:hypothetical protein
VEALDTRTGFEGACADKRTGDPTQIGEHGETEGAEDEAEDQ